MDLFDWETFRATPLSRDPNEHVIISGFVKPEALGKINADYPAIEDTGSFPIEGLRFGPGFSAHGAADMPVWGPIFQYLENYNEAAVRQRIKNLCDYLESMQEK